MNIFIITDNAKATFEAIKEHLPVRQLWRAGFRDVDSDDYRLLAPSGVTAFEVQ